MEHRGALFSFSSRHDRDACVFYQLVAQSEAAFPQFGHQVESVFVVFWLLNDKNSHRYLFLRCLKRIQALFLLPRSAKQPVDVCCISIKHSLFQRVHLFTLCVFLCACVLCEHCISLTCTINIKKMLAVGASDRSSPWTSAKREMHKTERWKINYNLM